MIAPYDPALRALLQSTKTDERAMARNLIHDHRLTTERIDLFDRIGGHPRSASELGPAIRRYFEKQVRTRLLPDFVYRKINGANLITGKPAILPLVHKDAKLVRVIDLNGLDWVLLWAKTRSRWAVTFASFPSAHDEKAILDWFDERLLHATDDQRRVLVGTVLGVMNEYRKEYPYQPAWATSWVAFRRFERKRPERWLQLLGVTKGGPRWIVLLAYPISHAGSIVRPTQLDAGWYPQHFPSPPQASLSSGGHPMDLRLPSSIPLPLPEYIHRQIDHATDHIRRIGRTSKGLSWKLADQRMSHHQLLAMTYGRDVYDWMDNPL